MILEWIGSAALKLYSQLKRFWARKPADSSGFQVRSNRLKLARAQLRSMNREDLFWSTMPVDL
jgi:hypothetical protein